MRPRLEARPEVLPRDRRDLRQHRRQRGGPPAAAPRRGVRRGATSWPRWWSTSTPRAASSAGLRDQPRVPPRLRPRRRAVRPRRDHAPTPSTRADFPLTTADGRRYRHLPLRNTNKKFNPVTARTLHFPVWGDPGPGGSRPTPFAGAVEVLPVFGDGAPGGVALVAAADRRAARRPGLPVGQGPAGRAGRRLPAGLARTPTGRKKLRTIWLAEEVGLHRHRRRRAQGARGPRLRVAQADRAASAGSCRRCPTTWWCSTSSPAAARPGTPSRSPTPRTAAPVLPLGQLRRADPARAQRPARRAAHRRRHHPRPAAGRRRRGRRRARGADAGRGRSLQGWVP